MREGGRIGLVWTQLIFCFVQEHGVLDLNKGEKRKERGKGEVFKGRWKVKCFMDMRNDVGKVDDK